MNVFWLVATASVMLILLLLKVPVAVSIGSASLFFIFVSGNIPRWEIILPLNMMYGVNSFVILTIPMFVWVGQLVCHDKVSKSLFSPIRQAVGWWRGGLMQINMLISGKFAALSGSAVADAVGPSRAVHFMSVEAGYDKEDSAAATAVSSILSIIIPPSIPLILWGVTAEVSIGRLWAGSIIPGLMILLGYMITVAVLARMRNYPKEKFLGFRSLLKSLYYAFPALLAVLIIWGGVFGGIVTPTEAAAVAVIYLIIISIFFYRISLKEQIPIIINTAKESASILFIVAVANVFAWIMTFTGTPAALVESILGLTNDPLLIYLLIIFVLLILGTIMETISLILVVAPILSVVPGYTGIDPVSFGIVCSLAIGYGLLTPPFGMLLFVTQRVTGVAYMKIVRKSLPYFITLILVLLLLIFFPQITLYLPNLFYGK